jgi:oleate hydratase
MQHSPTDSDASRHAYIVGGGIAGLAAAALLVRDGGIPGEHIHVLEQSDRLGGSLDGAGNATDGYVIRGGRMFERHFACTFDLFDSIPSLTDPDTSVTDEILEFTQRIVTSSKSRLVAAGKKIEAPSLDLGIRDKWRLGRLFLRSEASLDGMTIEQYFAPDFFETNFWFMWSSMFAFQPWHSVAEMRRYMRRFMHLMPGFNRLEGIHRTTYNQFDSLILPLTRWLEEQGVQLATEVSVLDLEFSDDDPSATAVTEIVLDPNAEPNRISVDERDLVFVTLGSMTEDSALGSMTRPATVDLGPDRGAWGLWRNIARRADSFGRPEAFCGDVPKSSWESFTVTLTDPTFFECMERFTGNPAGTGGLVTFKDSTWRMSVVLAYQPHFLNQPSDIWVFWGYALHPNRPGDRVGKPMSACSGQEILEELFHHLPVGAAEQRILSSANCIPCAMPYITSQFMPRSRGDRPPVLPAGTSNLAFLGQFCEVPEDTVFTVEYSVRTAQTAVYGLLGSVRRPTSMYRGYLNPLVILRAARAMS